MTTTRALVSAIVIFLLLAAFVQSPWVDLLTSCHKSSDLVSDVLRLAALIVLVAFVEASATWAILWVFITQLIQVICDILVAQALILLRPAADVSHRKRATDYFDAEDFGCDSEVYFNHVFDGHPLYASWQRAEDKTEDRLHGALFLVSSRDGALRATEGFGCGGEGSSFWEGVMPAIHESHDAAVAAGACGARNDVCCGQELDDGGVKDGHLMGGLGTASFLASAALPSILEGNEEAFLVESNQMTVSHPGASALAANHGPAGADNATPYIAEVSPARMKRARRGGFMAPTASSRAVAAEGKSKKVDIAAKKQRFDSKRPRAVQKELAQMAASHEAMVNSLHVLRSEYGRGGKSGGELVAAMKTIGRAKSLERKITKSLM